MRQVKPKSVLSPVKRPGQDRGAGGELMYFYIIDFGESIEVPATEASRDFKLCLNRFT